MYKNVHYGASRVDGKVCPDCLKNNIDTWLDYNYGVLEKCPLAPRHDAVAERDFKQKMLAEKFTDEFNESVEYGENHQKISVIRFFKTIKDSNGDWINVPLI